MEKRFYFDTCRYTTHFRLLPFIEFFNVKETFRISMGWLVFEMSFIWTELSL